MLAADGHDIGTLMLLLGEDDKSARLFIDELRQLGMNGGTAVKLMSAVRDFMNGGS